MFFFTSGRNFVLPPLERETTVPQNGGRRSAVRRVKPFTSDMYFYLINKDLLLLLLFIFK